jgi:phosphatidylserine/phosphatidylglycerophosphate/cardiolipin synthase-like enzyme
VDIDLAAAKLVLPRKQGASGAVPSRPMPYPKPYLLLAVPALLLSSPLQASKKTESLVDSLTSAIAERHTTSVPAAGTVEIAFSPGGGSQHLVVKVIDSARSQLRVLAYSFTSAAVTSALLHARKRGVDVKVVADHRNNISEDRSGKARAALSALANAGIDVRTISAYPIHHDKVIVADGRTVELGSFNFSDAAANRNSENVLVNWDNPKLAEVYTRHFERNYRQAVPYEPRY